MLKNTYLKLQNKEDITVAYFGGSITEGAGSTDKKTKGWRSHTTDWLRKSYPCSNITEINATLGGTGSDLAIFRIDDDVLKYAPDLLFIEFCVNDTGVSECEDYEEAIVRRTMKISPKTDIVLVRMTQKKMYERSLRGEYDKSYLSYERLAKYYGLPLADLGEEINSRVRAGEGDYTTYTKDNVHPNDLGHVLLAEGAIRFLKRELEIPAPSGGDKYASAHIYSAADVCDSDFYRVNEPFCGENGQEGFGYLSASEAGKHIKFSFCGIAVGMIYMTAHDSGDIKWRVDGGEYKTMRLWDEYALRFDRVNYTIFTNSLPYGEHTLEIVTTGERDERSHGVSAKISAILVS